MKGWAIERRWSLRTDAGSTEEVMTRDLVARRVCCLLGAAGVGKTFELKYLEELESGLGLDVRSVRLAAAASSPDRLAAALDSLSMGAAGRTVIYLDAIDEAMIPVVTTGLILESWIARELKQACPILRISCRSAIWPRRVQAALASVYGTENITIASLQPLSDSDIRRAASSEGVDEDSFLRQVRRSNVLTLAQQPLTLRMLLRLFLAQSGLPGGRKELFSQAVDILAHEREERRELGTVTDIPPAVILEAAERLAAYMVLSGCDSVDLSDEPPSTSLGWLELSRLPSAARSLDERLLKAIGSSGLGEGDGVNRFRFIHRQITEYLAGSRLAKLPPHQAMALLESGLGPQAGVAGPLRETAAFAASENSGLAQWVAETDPEVIGLSDVADDSLRRRATLRLLERFRQRELTDGLLVRDELPIEGLRYATAAEDLRPVLKERGEGCEDVLEIAIDMIEGWQVSTLHGDLADLVLDPTAPLHPSVSAGYVLARSGDRDVRKRLKPLIAGSSNDPDDELKGLALRCCWPGDLSAEELFAALRPWRDQIVHGAYFGFVVQLDGEGFDAAGDSLRGLAWARAALSPEPGSSPTDRIGQRIAHRALAEIDDPNVAASLAELLWESARKHADSPLGAIRRGTLIEEPDAVSPPLFDRPGARRILVQHLVRMPGDEQPLWWIAHHTPGLVMTEDFVWLLENAVNQSTEMRVRENYVEFARFLPFYHSHESVEAWLKYREDEPIRSKLDYPLSVKLGSDEARGLKKNYAMQMKNAEPKPKKPLVPAPDERVRRVLELAETKDSKFFFNLTQELTLSEDSTQYEFQRFLAQTPGWKSADAATRGRIVDAAKRVLTEPSDEPETCRSAPLNSILVGHMAAVWLLLDQDPGWVESMPDDWWVRWSWYFLRELRPSFHGEPEERKVQFFRLHYRRAAPSIRTAILELSQANEQESQSTFTGLLELSEDVGDAELDSRLLSLLHEGMVGEDRGWHVARHLLHRDYDSAIASIRERLDAASGGIGDNLAVDLTRVLLREGTSESWDLAISFVRRRSDLAKRVLANFAHARFDDAVRSENARPERTAGQVGQLVGVLLEQYPPEADVKHHGAFRVSEEDSAVFLRDRLIGWLGEQSTSESLEALRELEQRYGQKYPWLRRPRSAVERAYRRTHWSPVPPAAVAALLSSSEKHLIRNGADAVAGILTAIDQYEWKLRHASPSALEDLWNTPTGGCPSPKDEERISEKLCEAIRLYFGEYAVAADREVQVFRRSVPKSHSGAAGSEVDVLARVPALGTAGGDPIAVPIEVKRSDNNEAKTGLRAQLVDRYMSQLGSSYGVFVVAWLNAPNLAANHRPVWPSLEVARANLDQQAVAVAVESSGSIQATVRVIDASLV